MEGVLTKARILLEGVEQERIQALAEVAEERAKGLTEVVKERARGLAEVETRRAELNSEIVAMRTHQEKQQGLVKLNIGGYHFETSIQTLRRVPHTFFDAYFSGRYAQDVCRDGSIFVDRDGEHFAHILEYMRDGVVSVTEPGARPNISLFRTLKREFGFYCIELSKNQEELEPLELTFAFGGRDGSGIVFASMERLDVTTGIWIAAAAMSTARCHFGACVLFGHLYVTGGEANDADSSISLVERYSPLSDTWCTIAPLPAPCSQHAAVAVGSALYVLGGYPDDGPTANVFKYDSTEGAWSQVTSMPDAIAATAACAVSTDIYVFGGFSDQTGQLSSVFKYDTLDDEWISLAPMPRACFFHSAILYEGFIYIIGGGGHQEVLRFDLVSGAWSTVGPTLYPRNTGASFVRGGYLYAAGGDDTSSVERYDVATNTWTAVACMIEIRQCFGAVTIGSIGSADERNLFDDIIAKASH
jgi:hypothetical protein